MDALELAPFQVPLLTNIAQVHLRLQQFEEAVEFGNRAVYIDKTAVKAYFRRAVANRALGNLIPALKDLQYAQLLQPDHEDLLRELEETHALYAEQQKEQALGNVSQRSEGGEARARDDGDSKGDEEPHGGAKTPWSLDECVSQAKRLPATAPTSLQECMALIRNTMFLCRSLSLLPHRVTLDEERAFALSRMDDAEVAALEEEQAAAADDIAVEGLEVQHLDALRHGVANGLQAVGASIERFAPNVAAYEKIAQLRSEIRAPPKKGGRKEKAGDAPSTVEPDDMCAVLYRTSGLFDIVLDGVRLAPSCCAGRSVSALQGVFSGYVLQSLHLQRTQYPHSGVNTDLLSELCRCLCVLQHQRPHGRFSITVCRLRVQPT